MYYLNGIITIGAHFTSIADEESSSRASNLNRLMATNSPVSTRNAW